jgi:coproporphyrinogen III oxidase-like Fe-S oxidoreductase
MKLDKVIAGYLREYSRRRMHFPEEPTQITLPRPEAGRRYLLYLHIPFCKSLCPFCSFHRVLFQQEVAADFFAALRREIDCVSRLGFEFDELYIGGGTPTVLPDELRRTIDHVRERHSLKSISIETNPDDLVDSVIGELVAAGVNRVSVGVQSFDDRLLDAMQRRKPYGDGQTIIGRLKGIEGEFDTLNVDMIFNIPAQTEDSLNRDLDVLTREIGVDQVSFYPLMTLNSARERMFDAMGKVDYSREESLYRLIVDRMKVAGYDRASVWCFSRRPGMFDEYIAERDEYLGLGSGAFSYLDGSLYASTFSIPHYLALVDSGTSGTVGELKLNERDRMRYFLLLRLFSGGLEKSHAEARFADRFQRTLWPEISLLQALGAVRDRGEQLELTEKGRYLWVVLMREFFTGVNNLRDQMRHVAGAGPG